MSKMFLKVQLKKKKHISDLRTDQVLVLVFVRTGVEVSSHSRCCCFRPKLRVGLKMKVHLNLSVLNKRVIFRPTSCLFLSFLVLRQGVRSWSRSWRTPSSAPAPLIGVGGDAHPVGGGSSEDR